MSRLPTDYRSIVDDTAWLSARIGPRPGPGETLIFYDGTAANDRIVGSLYDDYFDMSQGGDDVVIGRSGEDVFYFGAAFTGADRVDGGGGGTDRLVLNGDYSNGLVCTKNGIQNIFEIILVGGSYDITGEIGATWQSFRSKYTTIDASSLTKHQNLTIEVATEGKLYVTGGEGDDILYGSINGRGSGLSGGDGDDTLIGGSGGTRFYGGLGADRIHIASSRAIVQFGDKLQSTIAQPDIVEGFDGKESGGRNKINLYFDSDDTVPYQQNDFHLGFTDERVGDIIFHYDPMLDQTIMDVFTDHDDVPDFVLHLTGNINLTIADFHFLS